MEKDIDKELRRSRRGMLGSFPADELYSVIEPPRKGTLGAFPAP